MVNLKREFIQIAVVMVLMIITEVAENRNETVYLVSMILLVIAFIVTIRYYYKQDQKKREEREKS